MIKQGHKYRQQCCMQIIQRLRDLENDHDA